MPLYRPSELQAFLNTLGVEPKKVLSQNFLIDGNIVNKIVACSQVATGDIVLEIGPGPGVLTEALLDKGARVIAVERDEKLAEALKRLSKNENQLFVYADDILAFPIEKVLAYFLRPGEKIKVIANLPYHLTSAIVAKLVPMYNSISSLTLMVQDEVARRFTAKPREKEYSSFSLFLQIYTHARYAFSVSPSCFFPAPRVGSAVVFLELKPPITNIDLDQFFIMTRTAFHQRRKMIRSTLRSLYPPEIIEKALEHIGCSKTARPEELSAEQFMALFRKCSSGL